jgi:hypothetical protein
MRWGMHVVHTHGEEIHTIYFVEVPERKIPLGKTGHRWEDGLKWILKDLGDSVNWIYFAQYRNHWGHAVA